MSDLQAALSLFEGAFGRIDNVKLQLGVGEMTQAAVGADILAIARALAVGQITGASSYPESVLMDRTVEA